MATPKEVLKGKAAPQKNTIRELISRVFTTRQLLHFAHWSTKSYAQHNALGDLYDDVIEDIDEIVEVYQGKFGVLSGLKTLGAEIPTDICKHIKEEADWVEKNRNNISKGISSIQNLLDTLTAKMFKTIYKLENLK